MNIWAIDKDLKIKFFLLELIHRFGENTFSLLENNSDHFQSVEIYLTQQPELSAYIHTIAQNKDKYAIDLIYPVKQNNIIGANENLNLEQILSILSTHFNLPI